MASDVELLAEGYKRARAAGDNERARKYGEMLLTSGHMPSDVTAAQDIPREDPSISPSPEGATPRNIVRAGLQGITFGWADEVGNAIAAPIERAGEAIGGALGISEPTGRTTGEIYGELQETQKLEREAFREDQPKTAIAAELAGGLATGFTGGAKVLGSQALKQASKLTRIGTTAAVGATEGGIYGAGVAEPGERLESAKTGAIIGAIAAPVGGYAIERILRFGGSAARFGWKKLTDTPRKEAIRAIRKAAEAEGIDADDAVLLYDKLGPEATLADLGENFRSLARAAVDKQGAAKTQARKLMNERQAGQHDRLMDAAEQAAGARAENFRATMETIAEDRLASAKPLYDAADEVALEMTDNLSSLLKAPTLKAAIKKGSRLAADEGEEIAGKISEGVPPTMKQINYAKTALDQKIEALYKSGKSQEARTVVKLKNRFLDYIDDVNPDYKKARSAWAGESQLMNAMQMGQKMLKTSADDIDEIVSRMGDSELEMFRLGAVKALRDKIDDSQLTHDAVKKLVGSKNMQRKMDKLFKSPAAKEKFIQTVQAEAEFARTRAVLAGGSPTAERLAGQEALVEAIQPRMVTAAARGDTIGMGLEIARKLIGSADVTPEVIQELTDTLLRQGLSSSDIQKILSAPQLAQKISSATPRGVRAVTSAEAVPVIEAVRQ